HHGMGRAWKCFSDFSRNLRIHSGSDFIAEISSTTASLSPFFGTNTECAGSCQPKRYPLESSSRCCSWVCAISQLVYPWDPLKSTWKVGFGLPPGPNSTKRE